MSEHNEKELWKEYRKREYAAVEPILLKLGFEPDTKQPHIEGERYLMQAVTTKSGRKIILLGHRVKDGKQVVIKATRDRNGTRELMHERTCREMLQKIGFAYDVFFSPEEIAFIQQDGFTISIQAFIETTCPFLERPLQEQFSLVLKAFKAQESAHSTTYDHRRRVEKIFGSRDARDYIQMFETFKNDIVQTFPKQKDVLHKAEQLLRENAETIEQYSHFLTHTDFVPHNFRVVGDNIYLLDHSGIRFGNKYEGWARFLNFMTLYNRPLEKSAH